MKVKKVNRNSPRIVLAVVIVLSLWLAEKLAPHPKYAKVFFRLGYEARDRGHPREAKNYFTHAAYYSPRWAPPYNQLGLIYSDAGKNEKAIEYFEKAIIVDSNFADGYYNLGTLYFRQGRYQEAVDYFERSLDRVNNAQRRYHLGLAYSKVGEKGKALDVVKELKSLRAEALAYDLRKAINLSDAK